jgi:hypothetical protein
MKIQRENYFCSQFLKYKHNGIVNFKEIKIEKHKMH